MGEKVPQTLANHTRFDPLFHFVLAPLSFGLLVWSVLHMVRHMSNEAIALVFYAFVIFLAVFKTRTYALKVQDRVIRLEESLRLAKLAPNATPTLSEGQMVALRFACDAELPGLAEKASAGKLTSKQIKQAIQNWRPDYFRV